MTRFPARYARLLITAAAAAAVTAAVMTAPALAAGSAASAPSPAVVFGFKNMITITGTKTIGTLRLPSGGWVIFATADARIVTGSIPVELLCTLTAGNSEDQTPPEPSEFLPNFALSIAHKFTRPGSAALTCDTFGATVNLIKVKITAIKAGTLSIIRL